MCFEVFYGDLRYIHMSPKFFFFFVPHLATNKKKKKKNH
jgi:hypothetical protein